MPAQPPSPHRPQPRPWRFITVGAILGFIALGVLSMMRPDSVPGYDITYEASQTLGLMSLFGAFLGGLLGALTAAVIASRR